MIGVLIALQIATANPVKIAECNVFCIQAGYDGGTFLTSKRCACFDYFEYSRVTEKKIKLSRYPASNESKTKYIPSPDFE